ncbi:hypothetical protein Q604_UNBC06592G0001, partial [human gut metagenome]
FQRVSQPQAASATSRLVTEVAICVSGACGGVEREAQDCLAVNLFSRYIRDTEHGDEAVPNPIKSSSEALKDQ